MNTSKIIFAPTITSIAAVTLLGFSSILLPVADVRAETRDWASIMLAQADGKQQGLDQATTASVKTALMMDSELKTQTILVDTINGTVRLMGQVSSAANFGRASEVVGRVPGVKSVDNQLVVKDVRPL